MNLSFLLCHWLKNQWVSWPPSQYSLLSPASHRWFLLTPWPFYLVDSLASTTLNFCKCFIPLTMSVCLYFLVSPFPHHLPPLPGRLSSVRGATVESIDSEAGLHEFRFYFCYLLAAWTWEVTLFLLITLSAKWGDNGTFLQVVVRIKNRVNKLELLSDIRPFVSMQPVKFMRRDYQG